MDPRIQNRIRIHPKISWIRNTGSGTLTVSAAVLRIRNKSFGSGSGLKFGSSTLNVSLNCPDKDILKIILDSRGKVIISFLILASVMTNVQIYRTTVQFTVQKVYIPVMLTQILM
jgi:hypothetical protein